MSLINSNDIIGNQTRDLPACSPVHQPAVPPRAPTEGERRRDVQNYSRKVRLARTPRNHGNYTQKIRGIILCRMKDVCPGKINICNESYIM